MKRLLLTILFIAVAIASYTSCEEQEQTPEIVKVESVSIDQKDMTLTEGEIVTLTATVLPEDAADKTVAWSSSDESVVMVSSSGKVMAMSLGKAAVTAKAGDKSDFISVTVVAKTIPITGISLDKTELALYVGSSETLIPTITPEDATNKNVTWTSSDAEIATVDNGTVRGVKSGSATITVKTEDGDRTAECMVTVNPIVVLVESISLDESNITLFKNESAVLTASILPENASDKTLTWSSSDESVATVDDKGTVTAVSKGSAIITSRAKDGSGVFAECAVSVTSKFTFKWMDNTEVNQVVAYYSGGTARWYIVADNEVEWDCTVQLNGEVTTSGVVVEKYVSGGGHIAIDYSENKNLVANKWDIFVTTSGSVDEPVLHATLIQGCYEYTDLAQLNTDIIASGTSRIDRTINISADAKLYVTKKSGKNVFAQSSHDWFTGGILFYGTGLENKVDLSYAIYGRFVATTTSYNGVPEIIALSYNKEDVVIVYDGNTWPCEKVTITALKENYMKYVNVKTEFNDNYNGVTVSDGFSATDRNGQITDSTGDIALYVQLTDGTITGHITGTKLNKIIAWPTFNNTDQQIGLWSQPTEVKSIPGIITIPPTKSLKIGESFNLSATTNSSSTITFTSSNNSIATVSNTGLVTAVSIGEAIITASVAASGKYLAGSAECNVIVKNPVPTGAVDLGLSVYWATCNLGATKSEGYGDYYAWGETEPKSNYTWSTYKWCDGSDYTLTKYNKDSSCGTVDNKTILDLEDDAAHVILGGNWRMPTVEECMELIEKCSWAPTTLNGVNGKLITSTNGNSIFLPCGGWWSDIGLYDVGKDGGIWSSSLHSTDSTSGSIITTQFDCIWLCSRCHGLPIRPVTE